MKDKLKCNSTKINNRILKLNKHKINSKDNLITKELIKNKIKKRKEKIKSEIFYVINENMETIKNILDNESDKNLLLNTSNNSESDNFQNYSGEQISIISFYNSNSHKKNNYTKNEKRYFNKSHKKYNIYKKIPSKKIKTQYKKIQNNIDNKKIGKNKVNLKSFFDKREYLPKHNHVITDIKQITQIIDISNDSSYNDKLIDECKSKSGKINLFNDIFDNEIFDEEKERENDIDLFFSTRRTLILKNVFNNNNSLKTPQKFSLPQRNNNKTFSHINKLNSNLGHNFSLYDSASTANTFQKNKNELKIVKANTNFLKNNEIDLRNFFTEINLPIIYANKFIENGFDDINIILSLTKTYEAINNQNLKDIGIMCPGHRAKILVHIEEKAQIFPFYLEKDIIYNNDNKTNINEKNIFDDKLFKFLKEIKCEKYLNNFKINGYFNIELLYSLMLTRHPLNKGILKEDLYIEEEDIIIKIINKLEKDSKNYANKLKKRNTNNIYDDKISYNSCEICQII